MSGSLLPSDGIIYTRNLILRGMSMIYLVAFLSFYYQSPGLFGNNGILPARIQVEDTSVKAIHLKPTLLYLSSYIGVDTEYMIDILALLGVVISFTGLISQRMCVFPTFAAMWSLYFSLIQISQVFINQSDHVLLEAGVLLLIIAPFDSKVSSTSDRIGFIALRWFLVRFLFESGEVKLASHCPYWWSFTGMSRHFETMPLPAPLSWYSHNLPASWLKVTNIFTNFTELVAVWFFFFPNRHIRRYIFYLQIFLQVNIILTGNYGFLNYMLPILMLCLLDDRYFADKGVYRLLQDIIKRMFIYFIIFFIFCYYFAPSIESLSFKEQYLELLRKTINPAPVMAFVIIIATLLRDLVSHEAIIYSRSWIQKISAVNTLIAFSLISIALVTISMVPHRNLDTTTNITNTELGGYYKQINKFFIVNEYGQHLRKMRSDRFEIIFEHSQDLEGPWKEYEFLYKPWNVNLSLPFTGLYFARFDHKFYDVVTSSYRNHLWTLSTTYRLLQNDQKVLRLFGINSIVSPAPKYVRASLYKFSYTNSFDSIAYWKRKRQGDFIPPYNLENVTLLAHLRSMRISPNYKESVIKNQIFKKILDIIRYQVNMFEGSFLIFSVLIAAFVILITVKTKK